MAFGKLAGKFEALLEMLEDLVQVAEVEFDEPGSGAEKRKFVIDRINEDVNVPIIFSEEREAELIGVLVDYTVDLYNKGRLFLSDLADAAIDEVTEKIKDLF